MPTARAKPRKKKASRRLNQGARSRAARGVAAAAEATPISAIMSPSVFCVEPDFTVDAVTALFLERDISGAPVIDDEGHPIGVVSKTDLVRERFLEGDTFSQAVPDWMGESFHLDRLGGQTVAEVMMPIAFTLRENDSVARAASMMAAENIHRVPVVNQQGRVTGIITTFDLARWISQP